MKAQQPELDHLVDQRHRAVGEGLPVGQEREDHADREPGARQDGDAGDIDHDHGLQAGDDRLQEALRNLVTADRDTGIRGFDVQVPPCRFPHRFPSEQFQRGRGADGFDEVGLLLGLGDDGLRHAALRPREQRQRDAEVDEHADNDDERERRGIEKQDEAGDQRHDAVDNGADHTLRDGILHRLDRAETRDDVADVPLLEVVVGQPQQVPDQVAGDLEAQELPEDAQRPAADAPRARPE